MPQDRFSQADATPVVETGLPVRLRQASHRRAYLRRLAEIALERARCGGDSPSLLVVPRPLSAEEADRLLEDRTNLALIFGAETILFQDTVHALHVDATEWSNRNQDHQGFNVLGIRFDWLASGGRAQRALIVDDDGCVKEVAFARPVPMDMAMTLHLPRANERALHRDISSWCEKHGIAELNPYAWAVKADDKAETHRAWRERIPEIESPEFCLIEQGTETDRLKRRLRAFLRMLHSRGAAGVFVQPNSGTEGQRVERIALRSERHVEALIESIQRILPHDHALLREERGNVRFRPPSGDSARRGFRRITFRVDVAWDGRGFVAESGYVQVAPDENSHIASRGRGGDIVDISCALSKLYYEHESACRRIIPSCAEIEKIKQAACAGASALYGDPCRTGRVHLLGMDLLLETRGRGERLSLAPVLLEANPRPAGLSQAREIRGACGEKAPPAVSTCLWEGAGLLMRGARE